MRDRYGRHTWGQSHLLARRLVEAGTRFVTTVNGQSIVWGEFGRTPKINGDAGRDHWPAVSCALLAGGGMKTGQVIGSTTADGGYADERPIDYKDVVATLYHNLGINIGETPVPDITGRPNYLLSGRAPIPELV